MAFDDYQRLSALLKHCTVAVYRSGNVIGVSPDDRWIGAWNIARARLTTLGFLRAGSEVGPATLIKFTPKGAGKSTKHSAEGEAKNRFFDSKIAVLMTYDEGLPNKPTPTEMVVAPPTQNNVGSFFGGQQKGFIGHSPASFFGGASGEAKVQEVEETVNPHAAPRFMDLPPKTKKAQKKPTPTPQKNTRGQARKTKVAKAQKARKTKRA